MHFKDSRDINGLHLIELYKQEIKYDKPIYVGCTILDLSKRTMMDFHYNVIHKHFPGQYQLLYSDTDSVVYRLIVPDIYQWVGNYKEHFDLSESQRGDLKDDTNKKVLGKFKDEMQSKPIKEFVSLNPKVYSYKKCTLDELRQSFPGAYNIDNSGMPMGELKKLNKGGSKTLKGVSKVVVKNEIDHEDYTHVLETNDPVKRNVVSIRSFNHQLCTHTQEKIASANFYDKMEMIDRVYCVPFGYNRS